MGLPSEYVIDCKIINKQGVLKEVFQQVEKKHDEIRNHLQRIMPSYIEKINGVKSIIEKL